MIREPSPTSSTRTETPLANLRDLGGTPIPSGSVRSAVLFRSDDLSLSARDEIVDLVDRGLSLILDLRSPMEKLVRPHRYLDGLDLEYHSLSFVDDAIDPRTAAARMTEIVTASDLGRWYAQMTQDAAAVIVRGLELLANTEGATLFHCAAGKDRTGIFAAAVLTVLGADDEAIIADYARTNEVIGLVLERLARAATEEQEPDTQHWNIEMFNSESPLLRAHADAARAMLADLDELQGGMLNLLRGAGLTSTTEKCLQDRLSC